MVSAKLLSAALLFALVAGQQNNNQNQNGQNNNGQNNGQNNNGQNNGQNNNGQNGQNNNNNNGQNNNNQNGQNNNQNNGQNNQATATINANALQTGSFFDGTDALGASDEQVASETSQENFINFCAGQTLTNGLQIIDGSCNGIPMGQIPAKNKMVSTVVLSPQTGQILPAGVDFEIIVQVSNLQAGAFTNAVATYYSAPQRLNGQGIIIGHTHVTVQDIGDNMNPQNPPNPEFFAFFKGINDAGNGNGQLKADVPGGLPAGNYRVCTLTSNSNHAPVVMPVAQRGAQDDCTKFVVSDNAAADQAAQNAQNGQDQNGQNGQNNNQTGQNQNGQNNGQNGQQNGQNQNGQNNQQNGQNQNGQNNGQNNNQTGQNQNGQINGQNNQQNGQNQNGQNNQQNGQQNAQNNGQQNGQNSADAARQAAERQRQQTEQQRQQQQAEAQRQQQERQRQQQQQQQQQQGKKVRRTDGGSARFSRRAFVA